MGIINDGGHRGVERGSAGRLRQRAPPAGQALHEPTVLAGRTRLRPIMMTPSPPSPPYSHGAGYRRRQRNQSAAGPRSHRRPHGVHVFTLFLVPRCTRCSIVSPSASRPTTRILAAARRRRRIRPMLSSSLSGRCGPPERPARGAVVRSRYRYRSRWPPSADRDSPDKPQLQVSATGCCAALLAAAQTARAQEASEPPPVPKLSGKLRPTRAAPMKRSR